MGRTVLVVDDEPTVLDATASMLEDLGCEVVTATNGADALAELEADQRIELLMTDVNMPGMSGYELAEKAIKSRKNLQVIVFSGGKTDGHGFPLIRKPFVQADLRREMQRTLGGLC